MILEYDNKCEYIILPKYNVEAVKVKILDYKYKYLVSALGIVNYEKQQYLYKFKLPEIFYGFKPMPNRDCRLKITSSLNKKISNFKVERWMLDNTQIELIKLPPYFIYSDNDRYIPKKIKKKRKNIIFIEHGQNN